MAVRQHKDDMVVAESQVQRVGSSGDRGGYRGVMRPGICICSTSDFMNRFIGRCC